MIPRTASKTACLDYIWRRERSDYGVDLNETVERTGDEYISVDNPGIILCAVHSLYRMGMIEHRHDDRYEIPEW